MQTQVTPESPNFDPSLQTPPATPTPDHPAQPGSLGQPAQPAASAQPMAPQQAFMQSAQPVDPQQSEAEAIVGALSDRLAHHSKQAQKFLGAILQSQQPQQV